MPEFGSFTWLRQLGQLDVTIGLSYVVLLSGVGAMLAVESARAIIRERQGKPVELRRPGSHTWLHRLPFKQRFKRSRIYISLIPIWAIGFIMGFIGSVMGIGGGFLLVPMLVYLLAGADRDGGRHVHRPDALHHHRECCCMPRPTIRSMRCWP